jgi:hypothetical protein
MPPPTRHPPPRRRERRVLAATLALATGAPLGAAAWVQRETRALASQLTRAAGVPAHLGQIDADLTGAVRITDVRLGDLLAADALEAAVAMGSLLRGRLRADELRVEHPRVAVRVDADGDSDLARVARRLTRAAAPARPAATAPRAGAPRAAAGLRRVLVTGGDLTAHVAGLGTLTASRVALIPDAGGVRVVTGPVTLRSGRGGAGLAVDLDLQFSRAAAEVELPQVRVGRALAVGGRGTARVAAGPPIEIRELAAGRLGAGGPVEVRARIADGATARELAIDLARIPRAPRGGAAIDGAPPPPGLTLSARGAGLPLAGLSAIAPRGLDLRGARATGSIAVQERPDGPLVLTADLQLAQLVIDARAVAPHPVPLTGRATGELTVGRDAIHWRGAALELGAARATTSGWLRRGTPASGRVDAALAEAPCSALLAAIPAELRGPLDGMALDGALGARLRVAIDLAAPDGQGATVASELIGSCRALAEPPAADVTRLAVAGEQQLLGGARRRVGRGTPDHVALPALPAHVPAAFVAAEDGRFYEHGGFDVAQIARSLEIDLRERRLARGGSTISQQLVKNAFLSQRRSLDRKLHEAILTWRLEARLGKRQILERYLNVIELGPRVFGLGAAARHWFGVAAPELTVRQAAFLAALTAQPTSMARRVRRAGGLDAESAERVAVVLRAMRRDGAITAATYEAARGAPLGLARGALE